MIISKIIKFFILIFISLFLTCCAHKQATQNTNTSFVPTIEHNYPKKVALLIPLSGNLAAVGAAIRNGFLTAYYQTMQNSQSSIDVQIVDTNQGDITQIYQQAVAKGADFIIGPLTKDNVKILAEKGALPVPTLSLNTIDNYKKLNASNLYQFGLFSGDEADQLTAKAWKDNSGGALIISSKENWGENQANIISNNWQSLGGEISDVSLFNPKANLNKQISAAFNIDLSQQRAMNLKNILREKFKFIPRRRKDIDLIFLIAAPIQARQIKPLINFYFASNIPVYSTSAIYSGIPNSSLDRDLDGIIFCDIPWILNKDKDLPSILPVLKRKIISLWSNSYKRYSRLYALGIDSFYLMLNINQLSNNPESGIAGATGEFYIDNYLHIYRKLNWAKFAKGFPKPLSN